MDTGQVIANRFELISVLGEGGVGRVFRAQDTVTGRVVAVKVLRERYLEDETVRRRFLREARALNAIHHPNIIKTYGYGEDTNGWPFLVMELVEASSLALVGLGLMDAAAITELMCQLLAALSHIHGLGIIHRDIKPDNILVVPRINSAGQVKLLDFGFARWTGEDDGLTKTGAFGTPIYMAPEQVSRGTEAGPETDLYAVGVILYELLCGRPPFTGAHGIAVALKHVTDPVPPMILRPGLSAPAPLLDAVRRALEKDRFNRFRSAVDMSRVLEMAVGRGDESGDGTGSLTANGIDSMIEDLLNTESDQETTVNEFGKALMGVPANSFTSTISQQTSRVWTSFRTAERTWIWQRALDVCRNVGARVVAISGVRGMGRRSLLDWLGQNVVERGLMRPISIGLELASLRPANSLRESVANFMGCGITPVEDLEARILKQLVRWLDLAPWGGEGEPLEVLARNISRFLLSSSAAGVHRQPPEGVEAWGRDLAEMIRLASADVPVLLVAAPIDELDEEAKGFLCEMVDVFSDSGADVLVTLVCGEGSNGEPDLQHLGDIAEKVTDEDRLTLGPISVEQLVNVNEGVAGFSEELAEVVIESSGGNPLHAREIVNLGFLRGDFVEAEGAVAFSGAGSEYFPPNGLSRVLRARAEACLQNEPEKELALTAMGHLSQLGPAFSYKVAKVLLDRTIEVGTLGAQCLELLLRKGLLKEARDPGSDQLLFEPCELCSAFEAELAEHESSIATAAAWALRSVVEPTYETHLLRARCMVRAGQKLEAVSVYCSAAEAALSVGQWSRAVKAYEEADRPFDEITSHQQGEARARVWLLLGSVELRRGSWSRAQSIAASLHAWAKQTRHESLQGQAMYLLADSLVQQARLGDAMRAFRIARELFVANELKAEAANAILRLGELSLEMGRLDDAVDEFTRAQRYFGVMEMTEGLVKAHIGLGRSALLKGDFENAERLFHLALAQARDPSCDEYQLGWCQLWLARTRKEAAQVDAALETFEIAWSSTRQVGNRLGAAQVGVSWARALFAVNENERAEAQCWEAFREFVRLPQRADLVEDFIELGELCLDYKCFHLARTAIAQGRRLPGQGAEDARDSILAAMHCAACVGEGAYDEARAIAIEGNLADLSDLVLDERYISALESVGSGRWLEPSAKAMAAAIRNKAARLRASLMC